MHFGFYARGRSGFLIKTKKCGRSTRVPLSFQEAQGKTERVTRRCTVPKPKTKVLLFFITHHIPPVRVPCLKELQIPLIISVKCPTFPAHAERPSRPPIPTPFRTNNERRCEQRGGEGGGGGPGSVSVREGSGAVNVPEIRFSITPHPLRCGWGGGKHLVTRVSPTSVGVRHRPPSHP